MVCLVTARIARAQEAPPPAYLSIINGAATLERDGEIQPAVVNMPIVAGDILRTTSGRLEVVFPDGSAIEIDSDSEVEFITATRVRVVRGAMEHRMAERQDTPSASADYLPQDLRMYGGTLDRSGSWQYQAPYGNVWYPSVTPDWRPYYYGSWSAVPSYGWTWIGVDAWSWPTHHYGRWGYGRNAWFWIPGRTWSTAWVTWASAADYVSWCPLGFDGRPVFAISTGYNRGWNGWTVLPRDHFGARDAYTPHYSVDPRRIASTTPFIEHARAPVAMPRGQQSSVASRQPPIGSRPSPVGSRQPSDGRRQTPGDNRGNFQSPVGGSGSPGGPQAPVGSRQPSVGGLQSPAGGRQTAVERWPIDRGPGRATPLIAIDPRRGVTDPGAAASGPRSATSDQPLSTPGDRVPATGYRSPAAGYRAPAAGYRTPSADYRIPPADYRMPPADYRIPPADAGRGGPRAVPRSEMSRPGMPRSEVPLVIPPSRTQIMGGHETTVRSPEGARPTTGYQAPPAAYRPPAASPATESRPATGARAPERGAPASAPQSAAPRSGGESGRASSAPGGARHPR